MGIDTVFTGEIWIDNVAEGQEKIIQALADTSLTDREIHVNGPFNGAMFLRIADEVFGTEEEAITAAEEVAEALGLMNCRFEAEEEAVFEEEDGSRHIY